MSSSRRRPRRWPFVLLALALLAGAGGAVAYFEIVKAPEDVYNPDVEFTAPEGTEAPAKKPRAESFVWPTYGLTPQRTRYLDADVEPPYRRVWHFGGSKLIEFPPVIAKDRLFFTKNNGEVYAISAKTGKVIWRRHLGFKAASSPAWAKDRIFVTMLERAPGAVGKILALRARDGKVLWAKDLPSRSESSPLVMKGRVYFGSENGTVYALRAKDGREVWSHRGPGAVKAALAYSDGKLYYGDYAGGVSALDVSTGRQVWRSGTSGRSLGRSGNFYSTPAVAYGRVYLGNTDGRVYSFSARSGELAWSHSTGAFVYASPAVAAPGRMGPTVFIGSYDGRFYALDARTGSTRWSYTAGGRISGAATVVGDVVYFSNLGAKSTTGLDTRTGKAVWKIGRGAFNPVVSDGKRIYLTGYSSLYGFEPKSKRDRRDRD